MDIRDYLQSHRVPFAILLHRPVSCATRLAHSLHVPGRTVAKGVLVRADDRYVLAVLPATHRIDLGRLQAVLNVKDLLLAREDEVERIFTDCERGALPPFGALYGLRTVVDASLAGVSEIVFGGNLRHEGLRLRYRDFEALENPTRARFASTWAPPRRRPEGRRAG